MQDDEFIVIYHNCGNNTIDMIESILRVGAAGYHFGNSIDMKTMLGKIPTDIPVMGNVDPAVQFRNGTPESIRQETLRIMEACCPEYQLYHLLRLRYSARHALDEYRRVFRGGGRVLREITADREARRRILRRAFSLAEAAPGRPCRANGSGVSAQSRYAGRCAFGFRWKKEGQAGKPACLYTLYTRRAQAALRLGRQL